MKIRRFLPDFISQTGDTKITLFLRNYPNSSSASSPLGPFTITSATDKVDTRARARAIALQIENTVPKTEPIRLRTGSSEHLDWTYNQMGEDNGIFI